MEKKTAPATPCNYNNRMDFNKMIACLIALPLSAAFFYSTYGLVLRWQCMNTIRYPIGNNVLDVKTIYDDNRSDHEALRLWGRLDWFKGLLLGTLLSGTVYIFYQVFYGQLFVFDRPGCLRDIVLYGFVIAGVMIAAKMLAFRDILWGYISMDRDELRVPGPLGVSKYRRSCIRHVTIRIAPDTYKFCMESDNKYKYFIIDYQSALILNAWLNNI